MTWSEQAREASIEARRRNAQNSANKSARASATYKPSNKAKQDAASASEKSVAGALGGQQTEDNDPFDVVVRRGSKTYAVEVKTFVDNKNDKVTMHPASLERKIDWAQANKAKVFTVVVDKRTAGAESVYVRQGVGSFRMVSLEKTSYTALRARIFK